MFTELLEGGMWAVYTGMVQWRHSVSWVVTWSVSGPDHGQLPLHGNISLKYRARPHRHLPASPGLVGDGWRGKVIGGRDGGRERDSPDCLSWLSAHHNPLLRSLSHWTGDILTLQHSTGQVIMSGFNTSQAPAVFICIFQSVKISLTLTCSPQESQI